jgi:predicted nucleotidyltransferase component of viral defense system
MVPMLKLAFEIQSIFRDFYLAGGTAVMLKYNHRTSKDLDFFRARAFSYNKIAVTLRRHFAVKKEERMSDNIDFFIGNRKISFVYFPFKNIQRLQDHEGLKMASDYDIFLNKIYTAGRRINPKDPFDAAFLLKRHNWPAKTVKKDFERKFPDQSYELYLGALLNFSDYPKIEHGVKKTLTALIQPSL